MPLPVGNALGDRKDPEGHRTSEISVKRSVAGRLSSRWWGQTGRTTCRQKRAMWDPDFSEGKKFGLVEDC